jgi:hypothetical protein
MGRFNSRNTVVTFKDSTGVTLIAGPGVGDFTFSETNKENTNKTRVLDRGVYDCHIETDDMEQSWSITLGLKSEALTSSTLARMTDWMEQAGIYTFSTGSSATVTVNANSEIWAWITIVTMATGASTGVWTLPNCLGSYAFAEALEGDTLAVSGTNNGKITRA